jgi:hypothetical protein
MPSPFPGMDLDLEGSLWTTVYWIEIDLLRIGQRVPMKGFNQGSGLSSSYRAYSGTDQRA